MYQHRVCYTVFLFLYHLSPLLISQHELRWGRRSLSSCPSIVNTLQTPRRFSGLKEIFQHQILKGFVRFCQWMGWARSLHRISPSCMHPRLSAPCKMKQRCGRSDWIKGLVHLPLFRKNEEVKNHIYCWCFYFLCCFPVLLTSSFDSNSYLIFISHILWKRCQNICNISQRSLHIIASLAYHIENS